jgi:hypothetical protein
MPIFIWRGSVMLWAKEAGPGRSGELRLTHARHCDAAQGNLGAGRLRCLGTPFKIVFGLKGELL